MIKYINIYVILAGLARVGGDGLQLRQEHRPGLPADRRLPGLRRIR